MKAIQTRYHGPTNYKGARLSASDLDGNRVSIPAGNDFGALTQQDLHEVAARALCTKMGWTGALVGGALKDSYVFVFMPEGK